MPEPQLRSAEEEIVGLRRRIQSEEQTEARLRAEADQVLAEVQAAVEGGADRFSRENIDKVENAYREPDGKRDEIQAMRGHLNDLMCRAGQNTSAPRDGDPPDARAQRGDPIARRLIDGAVYGSLTACGVLRSA